MAIRKFHEKCCEDVVLAIQETSNEVQNQVFLKKVPRHVTDAFNDLLGRLVMTQQLFASQETLASTENGQSSLHTELESVAKTFFKDTHGSRRGLPRHEGRQLMAFGPLFQNYFYHFRKVQMLTDPGMVAIGKECTFQDVNDERWKIGEKKPNVDVDIDLASSDTDNSDDVDDDLASCDADDSDDGDKKRSRNESNHDNNDETDAKKRSRSSKESR